MATIPKQQVYQMWDADGTYLGVLQDVKSIFRRTQDINTIGSSTVKVSVGMNVDTPSEPVKAITTEDGKWLMTESGLGITTEGEMHNFGVDKSKIKNGNLVKITEISDYYPNGTPVFIGKVRRWNVNYGTNDDATLYLTPSSWDMHNRLVKSAEEVAITQSASGSTYAVYGGLSGRRYSFLYDFTSSGISNVSSIVLKVAAQSGVSPTTVSVSIVNLGATFGAFADVFSKVDNPNNTIGTATRIISSTSAADYTFTYTVPVTLVSTNYYGFLITATGGSGTGATIGYTATNATALGGSYSNENDGVGWRYGVNPSYNFDYDLYFTLYQIPPYTKATVTNFEPSTLLKTFINNYNAEDGIVTYTADSIESTGITISTYTFQANTVAEALDILLDLSPAGFYYTVDPGTNILTFKRVHSTADHVLIFKKHIQNLDLSASIENLKNDVYFTGGLSGLTNLFLERKNLTSIATFDTQIARVSDVRVTSSSVGGSIASNYLDKVDDEAYETSVTIIDGMTDIKTYNLGETIGFSGFGTFPDSIIIPIVRISRDMDTLEADLGALPTRQSDLIQNSQDEILAIQTVANPTQPS